MIRTLLVTALFLLLSLFGSGCSEEPVKFEKPDAATQFTFISGQQKKLSDYAGQWLLVNFWSVSCPPCFQEMPDLSRLHNELRDDNFQLIGVAMPYDRPDDIVATQQKMQLSYPVSIDITGEINQAFGIVRAIPSSYLLNPQGNVAKRYTGIITYEEFIEDLQTSQLAFNERK